MISELKLQTEDTGTAFHYVRRKMKMDDIFEEVVISGQNLR